MISVVIPSFNAAKFLPQTLSSVESEKQRKWELILIDDAGQEDGTKQLLDNFAKSHPDRRIKLIRHEKNLGVSQARRTGWKASRGEFVAFLDADDQYLPGKLETHIHVLRSRPKAVLVHGPVLRGPEFADPQTAVADWSVLGSKTKEYHYEDSIDYMCINRICNSSVICRREFITEDCFPPRMRYQAEDWFLWLRLAQHGPFLYHPQPLTFYREHPGSYFGRLQGERGEHEIARLEVLTIFFPYAIGARRRYLCAKHLLGCLSRLVDFHRYGYAQVNSRAGFTFRCYAFLAALFTLLRALLSRIFPPSATSKPK